MTMNEYNFNETLHNGTFKSGRMYGSFQPNSMEMSENKILRPDRFLTLISDDGQLKSETVGSP